MGPASLLSRLCVVFNLSILCLTLSAQDSLLNKYGVNALDSAAYSQAVQKDPDHELVNLRQYIPGVALDIRYATPRNFMNKPMYTKAAAYLRKPAADSLLIVQQELIRQGYGLKVFDAYRPYETSVRFYESFPDTTFVASPYSGSRHNRGCAIDLTIIELKTGKELDMPTEYDDFSPKAHAHAKQVQNREMKNRRFLQKIMTSHGFVIYPGEWWHFDFAGWEKFPVMNVAFEQLP